jgi:hypothetical protein
MSWRACFLFNFDSFDMTSFELLTFTTRLSQCERKKKRTRAAKKKEGRAGEVRRMQKREAICLTKAELEAAGVRRTGSSEAWMT